ncbi:MAG: nitroreductase family deazaflavin-dependent oxidoreductase [Acidimicrobiales bacterium]
MCKDALFRAVTGFHRLALRATGGRLLGRLAGMPVLLLTTTGRVTGRSRTTVLTTPVHDGDRIVLVASYGGDDRHPSWFLNLREDPDVTVEMEGRARAMRARIATDDEKADLWPQVVGAYGGYGSYQGRTDRDIPVVILEPPG